MRYMIKVQDKGKRKVTSLKWPFIMALFHNFGYNIGVIQDRESGENVCRIFMKKQK